MTDNDTRLFRRVISGSGKNDNSAELRRLADERRAKMVEALETTPTTLDYEKDSRDESEQARAHVKHCHADLKRIMAAAEAAEARRGE